jgi:DNA-binding CsgD family transcriptional regulator
MATFETAAVSIVRIAGESLELIGTHGYEEEEVDRYSVVPLSVPTPFSRSVLQGEALIDELEDVLSTFEALQMDAHLWSGFLERFGPGQVINSPIVLQGTVIGAFGGITRSKREWNSLDFAVLDGISAALGLWMTHPDTVVTAPDRLAQASILRLVESGRSNTSIAMTLGYSVSTVKQELQRTMRAMRVSDRLEAAARARSLGLLSEDDEP